MIAGLIAAGTGTLAIVALIAWLARAALVRADQAAAERVARGDLAARLQLAEADLATHRAALAKLQRVVTAYEEAARVAAALPDPDPAAHGVDQLRAAADAVAVPAQPAAAGDRSASAPGGLPDGAGAAGGLGDAGPAAPAPPMPHTDGIADVLR